MVVRRLWLQGVPGPAATGGVGLTYVEHEPRPISAIAQCDRTLAPRNYEAMLPERLPYRPPAVTVAPIECCQSEDEAVLPTEGGTTEGFRRGQLETVKGRPPRRAIVADE